VNRKLDPSRTWPAPTLQLPKLVGTALPPLPVARRDWSVAAARLAGDRPLPAAPVAPVAPLKAGRPLRRSSVSFEGQVHRRPLDGQGHRRRRSLDEASTTSSASFHTAQSELSRSTHSHTHASSRSAASGGVILEPLRPSSHSSPPRSRPAAFDPLTLLHATSSPPMHAPLPRPPVAAAHPAPHRGLIPAPPTAGRPRRIQQLIEEEDDAQHTPLSMGVECATAKSPCSEVVASLSTKCIEIVKHEIWMSWTRMLSQCLKCPWW